MKGKKYLLRPSWKKKVVRIYKAQRGGICGLLLRMIFFLIQLWSLSNRSHFSVSTCVECLSQDSYRGKIMWEPQRKIIITYIYILLIKWLQVKIWKFIRMFIKITSKSLDCEMYLFNINVYRAKVHFYLKRCRPSSHQEISSQWGQVLSVLTKFP